MYILKLNVYADSDGAAIVVKSPRVSSSFSRQLYNPQCFLQYENPTIPPDNWIVSYYAVRSV